VRVSSLWPPRQHGELSDNDRSLVLRVELGDFPYETVQIAASSSDYGALFVAVAEGQFDGSGNHAGVFVDYLMLTP